MSADPYELTVDTETAMEISSAMLKAAGEIMRVHGNSPNGVAILACGFFLALQAVGKNIDPRVPASVRDMLGRRP